MVRVIGINDNITTTTTTTTITSIKKETKKKREVNGKREEKAFVLLPFSLRLYSFLSLSSSTKEQVVKGRERELEVSRDDRQLVIDGSITRRLCLVTVTSMSR